MCYCKCSNTPALSSFKASLINPPVQGSASHIFCFSQQYSHHYYFALLFPLMYSILSDDLLDKDENKNKFNVLQYITHGAAVPDSIHFVELLQLVCSTGSNYCMWQLFRGVLMSSFCMGTTNIMT